MADNFVNVWYGDILLSASNDLDYWAMLDDQERKRADTFKQQTLQKKYIKTRGVLKAILARYLSVEPQQLTIESAEFGKPFINTDQNLYFNLSHKGNRFVLAVSNIDEIGVDIEQDRGRQNLSALVKKCFSEQEAQYWYALPEDQQTAMFYRFWVRKEAFVKAVGRGIALGLDQCVIDPGEQSSFLTIPAVYGLATDWKILDIKLAEEDVCAVVLKEGVEFEFKQRQWQ